MVLCLLRQSTWLNPIKPVHLMEIQLSTPAKFVGFVKINILMVMASIYGEMADGRKCGLLSISKIIPTCGFIGCANFSKSILLKLSNCPLGSRMREYKPPYFPPSYISQLKGKLLKNKHCILIHSYILLNCCIMHYLSKRNMDSSYMKWKKIIILITSKDNLS